MVTHGEDSRTRQNPLKQEYFNAELRNFKGIGRSNREKLR